MKAHVNITRYMRPQPYHHWISGGTLHRTFKTSVSTVSESRTRNRSISTTAGIKRPRAQLVNGRAMATEILEEVRREVDLMRSKHGVVPGLAVIMVGERRDSAKYVSMKQAVAESIGFTSFSSVLPASATHNEVLECIQRYNKDPRCHGILLQLPVPAHLDPRGLLGAIKVEKDVECFNPTNAGRMTAWRRTVIAPCTPLGVMEMLLRLGVGVRGKHAVVLGESSVVGLPMCLLLNEARATVSMVHKETPNPEEYTRRADIVVAATGVPELVRASWIKPGAVVVDVGINFVRDDRRPEGFRVAGDVHSDVREVASIVSPVPGGVGPMTVAMLMRNCANMAFLQSRWGKIAGALHPELAAENARRMHSAIVDLAMGRGAGRDADEKEEENADGRQEMSVKVTVAKRREHGTHVIEKEMSRGTGEVALAALERAGDSITDAELLTIINDSEKNAYGLLSFLELGSSHDQLLDARSGPRAAAAEGEAEDEPTPRFRLSPCSPEKTGDAERAGDAVGTSAATNGLGSGEEGSMKELDEWQLEAEEAARARGETVLPHSTGQDLLLNDDVKASEEGREWWTAASGCKSSGTSGDGGEAEGKGSDGCEAEGRVEKDRQGSGV